MSGLLFSTRRQLADEALAQHPQAAEWSERDRTIFRAGAMMGVTSGHVNAVNEWGRDGLLRAALMNALDNYAGPDDDTVPVLCAWLARTARSPEASA